MSSRLKGLALGITIGCAAVFLTGTMVTRNLAVEGTYTYLKLFNEVLSLVRSSYVDEVNTDSLMKGAYEGMLAELDPFSEYLTAQEYAEYSQEAADASKGAHGARRLVDPGLRVARKEGIALVVAVKSGSDADVKGITPGDHLRRIGDKSTREMPLYQIEDALAGAPGTSVAVSVARREEPRKIDTDLARRETAPESVTFEVADLKEGLGVIRIPHFGAGIANEVAAALQRADKQRVRRLLVDLRGNAWGGMEEAARTAGLFVGDTVVARLKSKETVLEEIKSGHGKSSYSGMVAILMSNSTAEAAEMFAAALHDGRGASLLGEASFGVGAVQDYIPLKNGAWLKLSVKKYVSPSGISWHGTGLKPDKIVTVTQENLKPAERLKQQLKQAVDVLRSLAPGTPVAGIHAGSTSVPPGGTGGL
ncbi:MAG TPA: S41 family peptidase [Patescibacteria group bacterium]|nr:S41 family peptidase [Patescibacteria group bacterium]